MAEAAGLGFIFLGNPKSYKTDLQFEVNEVNDISLADNIDAHEILSLNSSEAITSSTSITSSSCKNVNFQFSIFNFQSSSPSSSHEKIGGEG